MKKNTNSIFLVVWVVLLLMPGFAYAQLVPCGTSANPNECTFADFMTLLNNLIRFLVIISLPLVAITFAYAGFLYLTAMGNDGQISKARGMFTKVLMGFLVLLAAWLIVTAIVKGLIRQDFINDLPVKIGT